MNANALKDLTFFTCNKDGSNSTIIYFAKDFPRVNKSENSAISTAKHI